MLLNNHRQIQGVHKSGEHDELVGGFSPPI